MFRFGFRLTRNSRDNTAFFPRVEKGINANFVLKESESDHLLQPTRVGDGMMTEKAGRNAALRRLCLRRLGKEELHASNE